MTQVEQEEKISLADIWAIIKRYKGTVLAVPIICGIAASVMVTFFTAPQWEASAILKVGQVGQGSKVEPVTHIIVRMQHPSFADGVLNQSGFNPDELLAAKAIYGGSLKAAKIKDADLIEFRLRGYSRDMARTLADNTVSYLQKIHGGMMAADMARINEQIQAANEEMQALKSEMNALEKQLYGKRDWNSYNATLVAAALQDKTIRLRELAQRKLSLTEQLNPPLTFATEAFADATISEAPVSPRKTFIIGMSILIGLLGGLFIAFASNAASKSSIKP
jgi:uncharacterized protein involved in exopolysaccharide biosynthesis